jgi:hypothetical protein
MIRTLSGPLGIQFVDWDKITQLGQNHTRFQSQKTQNPIGWVEGLLQNAESMP